MNENLTPKIIGQMDNTIDHTFESANRVYDLQGIAPTINCCGGGGLQPKVIVNDDNRRFLSIKRNKNI